MHQPSQLLQIMALGAFCTADASLIVFLIGPEKSRPFTMAFHATIGPSIVFSFHFHQSGAGFFFSFSGAGFLAATFLVRPFLPNSEETSPDQICGRFLSSAAIFTKTIGEPLHQQWFLDHWSKQNMYFLHCSKTFTLSNFATFTHGFDPLQHFTGGFLRFLAQITSGRQATMWQWTFWRTPSVVLFNNKT